MEPGILMLFSQFKFHPRFINVNQPDFFVDLYPWGPNLIFDGG